MIWDFIDILTRRLLLWSGLSMLGGAAALAWGEPFWQGFGSQALLWGGIDAAIALFGRRGLQEKLDRPLNMPQAEKEARRFKRILLINAGLDVIYILLGAAVVLQWGQGDSFMQGSGWGVIIQGGFLLLFDLLHGLTIPREICFPDLGMLKEEQHRDFSLAGGRAAAVVIHGFPGTPDEIRSFAEGLNRQGWTVRGLLLPGHGAAMPELLQSRVGQWTDAVVCAVEELQKEHQPVLLVGYSMGGGLSMLAAPRCKPDALILLAPFWWRQTPLMRLLFGSLRIFLPYSFKPLPRFGVSEDMIRQGLKDFMPAGTLEDPVFMQALRDFRIPFVFVDQFRRMGMAVERAARQVQQPVLIIQGLKDPLVRPALTRRLAALLRGPVEILEVEEGHEINLPKRPGHAPALAAVLDYAARLIH